MAAEQPDGTRRGGGCLHVIVRHGRVNEWGARRLSVQVFRNAQLVSRDTRVHLRAKSVGPNLRVLAV